MIVRLNQIEVSYAEQSAGWGSRGFQGPVQYNWPTGTRAFEVLILDRDEHKRPLDAQFRRTQTRQLIPEVIAAMTEAEEHLVIRLDGPFAEGELLAVMNYAADPSMCERFAMSPVMKLKPEKHGSPASIRMLMTTHGWKSMCSDSQIGWERSVRLRAYTVPLEFINPLLDTADPDDERWKDILPRAGFIMSTVSGLESLYVITNRYDASAAKTRLMSRLAESAREAAGTQV